MQLGEPAFGQREFFGSCPAFKLAFPFPCGGEIGKGFGVDQLERERFRCDPAPGTSSMFPQTSLEVVGSADVDAAPRQAQHVNFPQHKTSFGFFRWQECGLIRMSSRGECGGREPMSEWTMESCPSTRCARSGPFDSACGVNVVLYGKEWPAMSEAAGRVEWLSRRVLEWRRRTSTG